MPPKQPTDEELQSAVDLVEKYGTPYLASKYGGVPDGTLRNRLRIAKEKGFVANSSTPPGFNASSVMLGADGQPIIQWVKADKSRLVEAMREIASELKNEVPKVKKRPKPNLKSQDDLLNLINIGDAHIGAYIWDEECGESFDLDIAKKDLCTAMDYLIRGAEKANTLVIAPVGDYLHADNIAGATSKGTPLDLDTRMPKVIRTGVAVLRYAIEVGLDTHPNVHVIITPGNHDEILSHCLTIMLDEVYSKEPRVTIHSEPTARHYMVWGKVLLGWVHGHKIKDQNIPIAVATEQSQIWGKTEYRYIYRGHHHHKSTYGVKEFNGAIVEQVRPLCPSDAFATGLGLMAGNDCMCITHHKKLGEVKRITTSLGHIRGLQGG